MMIKRLLPLVLLFVFVLPLQALPPIFSTDSLQAQLKISKADTNRVMLLLDLSFAYMCNNYDRSNNLDTALQLARQAIALSQSLKFYKGEGNSYLMLAKALRKKGEVESSKMYISLAKNIFIKHGYTAMVGQVYFDLTRYYSNSVSDVATKINLNEQALSYFVQTGDIRKQADVLKEQGDLHQLQENYYQSLIELQRALLLYKSINHADLQGVYDLLGFVSTKTGDYKAGLEYGLRAVKIAHMRGDTGLSLCTFYNRLGITYHALGQLANAHEYFNKSLAIAYKHNHIPSIIYLSGNISSLLLSYGEPLQALSSLQEVARKYTPTDFESRIIMATRFMDAYCDLRRYAKAQPYYYQVLQLARKHGAGSPGMATIYQSVIKFLLASKKYQSARRYLALNETLCRQQGSAGALANNHLQWFRLDSTLGSYPSAIIHFQRYIALRDSLLTESKNYQIARLEIEYQLEKKDQDLQLKEKNIQLLTERSKLQQHKLEQAHMIRNGTIAGLIMLMLLLGLGYNRYRLKQKSNQLLEATRLEINEKNQFLEQVLQEKEGLLDEKEWMLKEIHHRVRNNLQIVISLLNSQAGYLSDNAALSTIKESQHRVQAMALIHQKLYQSEKVARVEMSSYINDLVVYLRDSYNQLSKVCFDLAVEPLDLDVTLAVPLGLIINEAITNSLKYAFPEGRSGKISLNLQRLANTTYQLTIADDGVGLPPCYDPFKSRSLGMTLMHGLSGQLSGRYSITGDAGVCISLVFEDEQLGSTYESAGYTYRWHKPTPPLNPDISN